jgi:dihydrofolate synthase/folylpolyglutamate synthase
MAVFEVWIQQHDANLIVLDESQNQEGAMPDYQYRNWHLAHETYEYLRQRDGLPALSTEALRQTRQIKIPGRMEILKLKGKTVVLDGAHNAQKMAAFVASFRKLYPAAKPAVLIGLKAGKEYEELMPLLQPLTGRIITTAFKGAQDLPFKSLDPAILAEAFKSKGLPAESLPNQAAALNQLLSGPEPVVIITGSFYLLGQIRNNEGLA